MLKRRYHVYCLYKDAKTSLINISLPFLNEDHDLKNACAIQWKPSDRVAFTGTGSFHQTVSY
ncbi:hypothetical protein GDO81_013471 [Engystomops pustulosus]|uniref:Uncharacterized protein n=1 Tax=Engystomops pustulosus TaxID=76066 RepID=A0AAV7AZK8_ENGPU|nr:hypothetical protein GDO81_013471 [Engystomops pustulosus]